MASALAKVCSYHHRDTYLKCRWMERRGERSRIILSANNSNTHLKCRWMECSPPTTSIPTFNAVVRVCSNHGQMADPEEPYEKAKKN